MAYPGKRAALLLIAMFLGVQALQPGHALAVSAAGQRLITDITKAYSWAQPQLQVRTLDGKEYSLAIIESGKPVSLESAFGAKLLSLYITDLKGQTEYRLTAYQMAQYGAVSWQYIYAPSTKQLVRLHSISARSFERTTWYLTPQQIAEAARAGKWPASGVTKKLG